MKTKIALTDDQVTRLVENETKALRVKFEREVAALRKKYEIVEIEVDFVATGNKTEKSKLTDEQFLDYLNVQKLTPKEIANLTGYNLSYLLKKRKLLHPEK